VYMIGKQSREAHHLMDVFYLSGSYRLLHALHFRTHSFLPTGQTILIPMQEVRRMDYGMNKNNNQKNNNQQNQQNHNQQNQQNNHNNNNQNK